jgi:cysteine desulfurase
MTIYMDHQATTPSHPSVVEAMQPFWRTDFGNPHSSEHIVGWNANSKVESSKQVIADTLFCEADEIIFYSGATEANNHGIFALSNLSKKLPDRRQIIISAIEHKCVIEAAQFWSETFDLEVATLGVDKNGHVNMHELKNLLEVPTLFCSIMFVNNEVGTIQDIAQISEVLKAKGVFLHSDCAQALKAVDSASICEYVDVATFSGHKIGGPQGIGCAYIASDLQADFAPLTLGGGQQSGLRSGTLPLPLIVGLSVAFALFSDEEKESSKRQSLAKLRDDFWLELKQKIPGVQLNGPYLNNRHPGNLNIHFPEIRASDLLMILQPKLCASSGSACSSGSIEPSYVLLALYGDSARAESSVRLSLETTNALSDLENAVEILSASYLKLKES